jgi:hypothetical protein
MSSTLLSVLLVCNRIQQYVVFILIDPHVRQFSDGNSDPTLKNKSWPPIMPKQRERCLSIKLLGYL